MSWTFIAIGLAFVIFSLSALEDRHSRGTDAGEPEEVVGLAVIAAGFLVAGAVMR